MLFMTGEMLPLVVHVHHEAIVVYLWVLCQQSKAPCLSSRGKMVTLQGILCPGEECSCGMPEIVLDVVPCIVTLHMFNFDGSCV